MIKFKQRGSFRNIFNFLRKAPEIEFNRILEAYGRAGVDALASATPLDTGKTADSWSYTIEARKGRSTIYWTNSNVNNGVPIAVILQYGHGTRHGGYVQGQDYINPSIRPIFDAIAREAWREVTSI